MKKSTAPRTLMPLLGGLLSALALTTWQGLAAEAAVVNPRAQGTERGESGSVTDVQPGVLTSPKGAEVGAVQDFVLDLRTGRAVYAVGVFDRVGELRDRVFILPWEMVNVDLEARTFTLSEDSTALRGAPSFALDTWAQLPVSRWAGAVATYWREKLGPDFAAADTPASALSKAGDLVGTTIQNLAGEDVGTIAELMLDPDTGSIAYAVVSFEDPAKSNHTVFFALPWDVVQVNPLDRTFRADVDRKMFTENQAAAPEGFGGDSG